MKKITLGYTGQRQSDLSQKYLLGNGYRGFNPITKRFTAYDSLSPFGLGGPNGYIYCRGNPINNADPSGHCLLEDVLDLVFDITMKALFLEPDTEVEEVLIDSEVNGSQIADRKLITQTANYLATGMSAVSTSSDILSEGISAHNPKAAEVLSWLSVGSSIFSTGLDFGMRGHHAYQSHQRWGGATHNKRMGLKSLNKVFTIQHGNDLLGVISLSTGLAEMLTSGVTSARLSTVSISTDLIGFTRDKLLRSRLNELFPVRIFIGFFHGFRQQPK
ncbi:RHS repeat-associated core domain-containing protein [Edaphovirga cremea]|uniref:RHS repeat-associated core domain-containing protein n=1 Tax=Edaphovirga cremea TaxID=2267246 RepID=UPI003989461A